MMALVIIDLEFVRTIMMIIEAFIDKHDRIADK